MMRHVRITDVGAFCRRFFSTAGDWPRDIALCVRHSLVPRGINDRGGLLEFAVGGSVAAWNVIDHGAFAEPCDAPQPLEPAALRPHLILFAWRHFSSENVELALAAERAEAGGSVRWLTELDYLRRCYFCPRPPVVSDLLSSGRLSVDARHAVLLWWVHMCYRFVGHFFLLEAELARFLTRRVCLTGGLDLFILLRGTSAQPFYKQKRGGQARAEQGAAAQQRDDVRLQIGSGQWSERKCDRLLWGVNAYLFGCFREPRFRGDHLWRTYLAWMDPEERAFEQ